MMHGMMHGHGGANLMWIALIVIIIAIAFISLFMMLRITQDNRRMNSERKRALDILNERYAKGEVSDEEYERRRKTLEEYSKDE